MRNVIIAGFGFLLLMVQTVLTTWSSVYSIAPNLLLPTAIYLGVSHEVGIVRGASISFVLGYLFDSFCGSPMGLQTFVLVATFMLSRVAGIRLFMRGVLFQMVLTFGFALLAGLTNVMLRALFDVRPPFSGGRFLEATQPLLLSAFTTALVSPFVLAAVRRIDSMLLQQTEEKAVIR